LRPPLEASPLAHLLSPHSLSPTGPCRRVSETEPSPESSSSSGRSSMAKVEVAVDLAISLALSGLQTHPRHLDLTPLCFYSRAYRSRHHRQPSPELTVTTSTPPRAPQPLHTCPLVAHRLLTRTSTDLTATNHRRPSISFTLPKTLASDVTRVGMRDPCEEEGPRTI
jgi:hypothetical protein